jgi:hypothetical protein
MTGVGPRISDPVYELYRLENSWRRQAARSHVREADERQSGRAAIAARYGGHAYGLETCANELRTLIDEHKLT